MSKSIIIDLSSPISVKSKNDFIPFKSHLKNASEDIVDLCTPVKSNPIVPAISTSIEDDDTEILIDNGDDSYCEELSMGTMQYVPNENKPVENIDIIQPVAAAKSAQSSEEFKRKFFADFLKSKTPSLSKPASTSVPSSSSKIDIVNEAKKRNSDDEEVVLTPTKKVPNKKTKPSSPLKASTEGDEVIKKVRKPRAPKTTLSTISEEGGFSLLAAVTSNATTIERSNNLFTAPVSTLTSTLSTSSSGSSSNSIAVPAIERVMVPLTQGIEYEVVLIVDKRERSNPLIQSKLVESNIPCELSTLAVGDFLWIARPKQTYNTSSSSGNIATFLLTNQTSSTNDIILNEATCTSEASIDGFNSNIDDKDMRAVVLDCIAERKSVADLASSILDRRYEEQKGRLRACGVRSCVYVVEGEMGLSHAVKNMTTQHIKTAMIETHAGGLHVLRTRNFDHTIESLKALHWQVVRRFKKGACGEVFQTFPNFQKLWGKKSAGTIKQLFGHQLRQINGCSKNVAVPIINRFGSTHNFVKEMEAIGKIQGIKLISEMLKLTGRTGRDFKIGKVVAERIWNTYMEYY